MASPVSRRPILVAMALLGTVPEVWGDPAALERALLAGDWRALHDALGGVQAGEATWRTFLRGHSALALNRNDESVQQFLSVSTPSAIGQWDVWTARHAERHTDSSTAWYLRGDALARREAWSDATAAFTRALELAENNGLAWNARGVVHALKGRWKEAGDDFAASIARQPELADPYANTGVIYVLQSIGRNETLNRTFDEALRRSTQFRLATVGTAAMRFGLGEWDTAAKAFEAQSAVKDSVGNLAAINLAVVKFAQRDAMHQAIEGELVAGTSVTVQAGVRAPTRGDALNQDILANELGAIAHGGFSKWGKDGSAVLSAVSKASGLGVGPASVMSPIGRIAKAFEIGVSLGTSGSADAASRMQAKANQSQAALVTHDITRTMTNLRTHPNSEGFRNAASNWLDSKHSAQAHQIARDMGLNSQQIDALRTSRLKAGGAILSFQRAYTSRGGWGMYLPFGLVYTGFDPDGGAR